MRRLLISSAMAATLASSACKSEIARRASALSDAGDGSTVKGSPDEASASGGLDREPEAAEVEKVDADKPGEVHVEERALGEILCQEVPRLADKHGDDFSMVLGSVCEGSAPAARYQQLLDEAYAGSGTPKIEVIESETDKRFVTHLILAYAVKIPISSPGQMADLNIFEALEAGISNGTSTVKYTVQSRTPFPGQGSVEEIRAEYRTVMAEGAALFDRRLTYANQYLPSETTRDITVSLESLLDADNNQHYHVSRQMTAGLKNADNTTTMLNVVEMVIKNRIDPARVQKSIIGLSEVLAETTYAVAAAASKPGDKPAAGGAQE